MARGCHTEGRDGWKPDIEEVQFLLKKLKATYSSLVKGYGTTDFRSDVLCHRFTHEASVSAGSNLGLHGFKEFWVG